MELFYFTINKLSRTTSAQPVQNYDFDKGGTGLTYESVK